MKKVIDKRIKCDGSKVGTRCTEQLLPSQIFRIVTNKKTNQHLNLCANCFPKVYEAIVLNKLVVSPFELIKARMQNKDTDDIRHAVWKWTHKQTKEIK